MHSLTRFHPPDKISRQDIIRDVSKRRMLWLVHGTFERTSARNHATDTISKFHDLRKHPTKGPASHAQRLRSRPTTPRRYALGEGLLLLQLHSRVVQFCSLKPAPTATNAAPPLSCYNRKVLIRTKISPEKARKTHEASVLRIQLHLDLVGTSKGDIYGPRTRKHLEMGAMNLEFGVSGLGL